MERWLLLLQEFAFTVEYLAGNKILVADAMYRLNTSCRDDIEKPIDVEVPVLAIEDDVNQPTLDENGIVIPDTKRKINPNPQDQSH